MSPDSRIQRISDALYRAMKTGEIDAENQDLYQLASDLLIAAFPEAPPPSEKLCPFSLLVGFVAGQSIQKYEDESKV